MKYALDTNIIIRLLKNDTIVCNHRDEALNQGHSLIIPAFVDYEMWRGFYYRSAPTKEKLYRSLCNRYPIGEMTSDIWQRGARIYADLRNASLMIDDADILIAAFCIINGYILVTSNTRHFERIDGLQLVDWAK
jgi:predicted nucleic acid-binding protein